MAVPRASLSIICLPIIFSSARDVVYINYTGRILRKRPSFWSPLPLYLSFLYRHEADCRKSRNHNPVGISTFRQATLIFFRNFDFFCKGIPFGFSQVSLQFLLKRIKIVNTKSVKFFPLGRKIFWKFELNPFSSFIDRVTERKKEKKYC